MSHFSNTTLYNSTLEYAHRGPISFVNLVAMPLHVSHIGVIISRYELHQNVYEIMLNLSLSDLLFAFGSFVFDNLSLSQEPIVWKIGATLYILSVLFTFGMTLDRYVKVEYGLRYETIATKTRVRFLIMLVWIGSFILLLLVNALTNTLEQFNLIFGALSVSCCFLLLATSVWVGRIRNNHLKEITRMNRYFGIHGEQFNLLREMKGAVREMLQLNLVTFFLIFIGSVLHMISNSYSGANVLEFCSIGVTHLYVVSNPFVYLFVMRDLREQYLKGFLALRSLLRNQIHPAVTSAVENNGT